MTSAPRLPTGARRPGGVLPLVCIILVFLVGMVAFAIDTGYIAMNRTRLQAAADAGAHAGAYKIATLDGQAVSETAIRDEVKKFVALNEPITVLDSDIRVLRYNPNKAAGSRVST